MNHHKMLNSRRMHIVVTFFESMTRVVICEKLTGIQNIVAKLRQHE